ncbi:MAG TPA: outer membrane beta-barrel protein [Steroidobacteraceae bacterium]|jgi:OOP family OmpA-OmpF porin|nr:outer membrane beta-barrel protein [Steroidobacteraceae bacterium]
MKTKSLLPLVGLLALAGAAGAQGADHKWYVGLDLGQSKFTGDQIRDYSKVDDHSSAYTLKAGYRFVPWFALEGGYTDLGEFSGDLILFCPAVVGVTCPAIHQKSSLHGLLVNAVGIWPVAEHFQLNASLGAIYRELSVKQESDNGVAYDWTDKDTVVRFGLGMAVPVNPRFEIALDYVEYRDIGLAIDMGSNATVVNDGETSVISLGVRWRF